MQPFASRRSGQQAGDRLPDRLRNMKVMNQTRTFTIGGMTCQNCVRHVQRALSSVEGVTVSDVSIGSATVTPDADRVSEEKVIQVIREAGYQAQPAAA